MALSLLDWLYNEPSVGALVLFPQMLNRWNVSALMVAPFQIYQVVIITDSMAEFEAATLGSSTDQFQFKLHTFSELEVINQLLRNPAVDLIVFDDAKMLAIVMESLNLKQIEPKLIVLTTWGDMQNQLDTVTERLPSLQLLSLDFIGDNAAIEWDAVVTPMSPYQYGFYTHLRQYEARSTSILPFPVTRMVTLYTYPAEIADEVLKHQRVCQTDTSSLPDANAPGRPRWMHAGYLDLLEENGAKLNAILDGIVSHWPQKQIVFTRFNHRYGVDLIASFLDLLGQKGKNPYEVSEIYAVRCTDSWDQSIKRFQAFNAASSGVLIANVIPTQPLFGITDLHLVDTYAFRDVATLIDRCHKRQLGSGPIAIHIYVARAPTEGEPTADEVLSGRLTQEVIQANKLYQGLHNAALPIKYDLTTGLVVSLQSPSVFKHRQE